jgi:hypothetical protein
MRRAGNFSVPSLPLCFECCLQSSSHLDGLAYSNRKLISIFDFMGVVRGVSIKAHAFPGAMLKAFHALKSIFCRHLQVTVLLVGLRTVEILALGVPQVECQEAGAL